MKKLVADAGLEREVEVDSAGLIAYHEGEQADARMRAHAARRGYRLDSISRPVRYADFERFDLIIGMDVRNVEQLRQMAPDVATSEKVHAMMEYSRNKLYDYVPDPYYGGASGFELVLDLLEDACAGLLERIKQEIIVFSIVSTFISGAGSHRQHGLPELLRCGGAGCTSPCGRSG